MSPWRVANEHMNANTFIPLGMEIILLVDVKCAHEWTSIHTVNVWWAHDINSEKPMDTTHITPIHLKALFVSCIVCNDGLPRWHLWGFPMVPANVGDIEMGVQPLGQEGPGIGKGNPSSILAWKIPWTEEPGGLQSLGSQRVGQDWSNLARMQYVMIDEIIPNPG